MIASLLAISLFGLAVLNASGGQTPFEAQCRGRRPLVLNADNDHYYHDASHIGKLLPLDVRISKEGPRKYLEMISRGGKVTHLFANAVGQRANYDSKVADPIWLAIDEAKARGLEPDPWPLNAKKLYDLGVDPFVELCRLGRAYGVSVWISQRMNDVHHVDRPWNVRTNRLWYEHPEWHRSFGVDHSKLIGFWPDEAFNYALPEVREFEFAVFRELVDRYDAEGYELDFMRFWQHLTPGREREEAPILTDFIRRCRAYTCAKAKSRGHDILLSTRVPSSFDAARAFGFDPETWAREGLVDLIVVANFWATADTDFDFDRWRARIAAVNPKVTVLPGLCDNVSSGAAGSKVVPTDLAAVRGWADNVFALGAKGVYVFNLAWMTEDVQRAVCAQGLDPVPTANAPRRHLVTCHDCVPKGWSSGAQLPVPLKTGGRVEVLVGSAAAASQAVKVCVGFDVDVALAVPEIKLNGVVGQKPVIVGDTAKFGEVKQVWLFECPSSALRAGRNVVEVGATNRDGAVVWTEIDVEGSGREKQRKKE